MAVVTTLSGEVGSQHSAVFALHGHERPAGSFQGVPECAGRAHKMSPDDTVLKCNHNVGVLSGLSNFLSSAHGLGPIVTTS